MYLHLGKEVVVRMEEVVGIFDLEKTSLSKDTKKFLSNATKKKLVKTVSYEMPKTFVVCQKKKNEDAFVYVSQISCATLLKRAKEK